MKAEFDRLTRDLWAAEVAAFANRSDDPCDPRSTFFPGELFGAVANNASARLQSAFWKVTDGWQEVREELWQDRYGTERLSARRCWNLRIKLIALRALFRRVRPRVVAIGLKIARLERMERKKASRRRSTPRPSIRR